MSRLEQTPFLSLSTLQAVGNVAFGPAARFICYKPSVVLGKIELKRATTIIPRFLKQKPEKPNCYEGKYDDIHDITRRDGDQHS